jgi:RimJ/RimL family protein N-acetyltransferase
MQSTQHDDIVTPRLDLIAITPEALRAEQHANEYHHALADLINCIMPSSWPITHWEPHVYDFLYNQFTNHPDQLGWPRYMALRINDGARVLIGTLGAFSKTDPPTVCEIGYGVHPDYEGHGFTTEAANALIQYLRSETRIETIIAHTFPSLPASIRVMEKCGMVFDGDGEEEPGTIRYRLNLRP